MRKLRNTLMMLLGLVLLQQGLMFFGQQNEAYKQQKAVIEQKEITPSWLFYTESEDALRAEKQVRTSINKTGIE